MTITVDVYAVPAKDIEGGRLILERILGISLTLHDSSWRGGDYYLGLGDRDDTYTLQRNRLGFNEPAEEEHPDIDVILYVEMTTPSTDIHRLLAAAGFRLLRHREAGGRSETVQRNGGNPNAT